MLNDAHSIKKTMENLNKAEDLNKDIEERAIEAAKFSGKILKRLNKFKSNSFRPRIHGIDSEQSSDVSTNS